MIKFFLRYKFRKMSQISLNLENHFQLGCVFFVFENLNKIFPLSTFLGSLFLNFGVLRIKNSQNLQILQKHTEKKMFFASLKMSDKHCTSKTTIFKISSPKYPYSNFFVSIYKNNSPSPL